MTISLRSTNFFRWRKRRKEGTKRGVPERSPSLRETEQLLWRLIAAPNGVAEALRKKPVKLPIRGDSRLSAAERLDIYAGMYFYRIRDSLKEDFPAILRLLGETGFHNLITEYLFKHPSSHYSLRYAGSKLPTFLKKNPYKKFPFLSELARFEQALLTAFDAPDAIPLTEKKLKGLNQAEWPRLRLRLVPSAEIVSSQWGLNTIREKLLEKRSLGRVKKESTTLGVWRHNFEIYTRPLKPLEERLWPRLKKPTRFVDLCDEVARQVGVQKATTVVTGTLRIWLKEGLLEAVPPVL